MERTILSELRESEMITRLSWRVAEKLGGVWTVQGHMEKLKGEVERSEMSFDEYEILSLLILDMHSQHPKKLNDSFRAVFSRALRRLEEKGFIERYQEVKAGWRDGQPVLRPIKHLSRRPRATKTRMVRRAVRS